MSIFGMSGGAKVALSPRVKHNGVIKTLVSGWTKVNGVLLNIWENFKVTLVTEMSVNIVPYKSFTYHSAKLTINTTKPITVTAKSHVNQANLTFITWDGVATDVQQFTSMQLNKGQNIIYICDPSMWYDTAEEKIDIFMNNNLLFSTTSTYYLCYNDG